MQAEKTSLNRIKLLTIPGGTTIYDSTGNAHLLEQPTATSKLLEKGFSEISVPSLQAQGILYSSSNTQIKFVYPEKKQSLVSFLGVLPALTLIFTNPSEDPKNHPKELLNEVYVTQDEIEFSETEPATFPAKRISDNTTHTLSRLGHMISLINKQSSKSTFPPPDLRLYLPPVHIASQHAGDCGADALQTVLFFSDFFSETFASAANEIYKKYIRTEPKVLFIVDSPRLVEEVRNYFRIDAKDQKEEDVLFVFASMVRRFILIRLLDFGTDEEIASLNIPATACLVPSAVPSLAAPPKRRKSINALAGVTIARRISRIFDPKSMFNAEKKLMGTEITLLLEHTFYCLLFKTFHETQFKSIIYENAKGAPCDLSQITAILYSAHQTKKDSSYGGTEGEGHAISIFRNADVWYLQDDNIGIAQPLKNFDFEHYISSAGEVFFRSWEQLPKKTQLIEQGFFTEDQLRSGKAKRHTFYGYDYKDTKSGQVKQKICVATNLADYMSEYMTGGIKLMLVNGEIPPEKYKLAPYSCGPKETTSVAQVTPPKEQRVKEVPSSILQQLNTNYSQGVTPRGTTSVSIRNLRRNIQIHLNSFTMNTRRNVRTTNNASTRKVRVSNNAGIRGQLESF
jgi:hypothetical protein